MFHNNPLPKSKCLTSNCVINRDKSKASFVFVRFNKHETVISKKIANVSPDFTFNDSMLAFIALDGFLKGGIDHILNLQSLMVGDETYLVQEVRRDDGTEPLFLIDTWFVLPCFPS